MLEANPSSSDSGLTQCWHVRGSALAAEGRGALGAGLFRQY